MFNIGGGEFLVIAVIALIVLGPQRLPDAARQVGKAMSELRRLSTGFQNEIKGAFDETDPAGTAPPRNVLAHDTTPANPAPETSETPDTAARSERSPRPRRKAPLRAEPAPKKARPSSKGS